MKIIILLIFLLMPALLFAQRNCKEITVKQDEFRGTTTYYSKPTQGLNSLSLVKIVKDQSIEMVLLINLKSTVENYSARGVFVKLEDDMIIKDEEAKVECSYYQDGLFNDGAHIVITPEQLKLLCGKKVIKFQLDSADSNLGDISS